MLPRCTIPSYRAGAQKRLSVAGADRIDPAMCHRGRNSADWQATVIASKSSTRRLLICVADRARKSRPRRTGAAKVGDQVTAGGYRNPAPVSPPFAAVAERAMARLWTGSGCGSNGGIQRRSAKHDLTLPAYIGQLSCNDNIIGRGLTAHAIGEVWRHGGRPS
jgi:hypothetical protein